MIVLDFVYHLPSLEPAVASMEGKASEQKWPSLPSPTTVDSPDTDSARSTPEVGAEPKGAIPKSRSVGKLDAFRSSLREVSRNSSFKLGRKKTGEEGAKEEKKKSKKNKKKEAAAAAAATGGKSPPETTNLQPQGSVTSPNISASSESLTKSSKVSKATSLVRKLSIGRYRNKNSKDSSPATRALSPTSTSPELSPAASRTDISEDEAPSVASSTTSEGRQGPEGDDGAVLGDAPSGTSPLPPPATPSSPQPPPPGAGQSRLIAGGANKGLTGQSQAPSAAATSVASPPRQSLESAAPRKERDPALLETVPEAQSHEEAASSPLEAERSPPATPAFQSAFASLDEATPPTDAPGSSRAASAAFMSQRLSSAAASASTSAVDVATTKSQILSITTPALKKQQAFEEVRAAAVAAAAAANSAAAAADSAASVPGPKPSTSASTSDAPAPASVDDPEDEQFGDLEDYLDSQKPAESMSSAPPSAATVMAEARARLSQSLGGSSSPEAATQPVNEKREHLYKILVIGELGTGKTSIIKRYVHQFFSQHYRATIGVDFALKVLNWDANTVIRLQLWDIAGQERFGNMTRVYYKEAVGAFIVFDVTRAATFDAVIKWKQDLDAKVQLADGSPIPCVLLANKCDQQKEGIVNNAAKMDEYCREKGFSAWFETSAKENINIEDAARCLVTKILQNDKLIHNENGKDNDKFALDGKAQKDEKSGGKSCAC